MNPTESLEVETDERFPSGPWTGFFVQPILLGRRPMDMILTFRKGLISGEGRDCIGDFVFKGRYQVEDGKCWWTKAYVGKHSLAYQGFNEGKGIWGTWEYSPSHRGGFHIWPVTMGDPTQARWAESVEEPTHLEIAPPVAPILAPGIPEEVAEPVSEGSPTGPLSATRGR